MAPAFAGDAETVAKRISLLFLIVCLVLLSACSLPSSTSSSVDIAIYNPGVVLENAQRSLDPSYGITEGYQQAPAERLPSDELVVDDLDGLGRLPEGIAESIKSQKRVALVVGNADYQHLSSLRNPVNDAQALAGILEQRHFDVVLATNQSKSELDRVVRDFSEKARGADLALYFYSGHGMQVDGSNWMLPVDAKNIIHEADMSVRANSMNVVFDQMMTLAATSIIWLDACRDNPFVDQLARSVNRGAGTKNSVSGQKGLARVESFIGDAYVAFATAPGNVAYDGRGRYSPFTEALLNHLDEPVVELEALMRNVRRDVKHSTANELVPQVPWGNSALTEVVYF